MHQDEESTNLRRDEIEVSLTPSIWVTFLRPCKAQRCWIQLKTAGSPYLEAVGAPLTQLWTVNVVHFYFCLFLHVNLGFSQKIVDEIQ